MENLTKFHCASCKDKDAEERLEDYGSNGDKIGVCTVCGALIFHPCTPIQITSVNYGVINENVLHVA